jgi:hypothetical protein
LPRSCEILLRATWLNSRAHGRQGKAETAGVSVTGFVSVGGVPDRWWAVDAVADGEWWRVAPVAARVPRAGERESADRA